MVEINRWFSGAKYLHMTFFEASLIFTEFVKLFSNTVSGNFELIL